MKDDRLHDGRSKHDQSNNKSLHRTRTLDEIPPFGRLIVCNEREQQAQQLRLCESQAVLQ